MPAAAIVHPCRMARLPGDRLQYKATAVLRLQKKFLEGHSIPPRKPANARSLVAGTNYSQFNGLLRMT